MTLRTELLLHRLINYFCNSIKGKESIVRLSVHVESYKDGVSKKVPSLIFNVLQSPRRTETIVGLSNVSTTVPRDLPRHSNASRRFFRSLLFTSKKTRLQSSQVSAPWGLEMALSRTPSSILTSLLPMDLTRTYYTPRSGGVRSTVDVPHPRRSGGLDFPSTSGRPRYSQGCHWSTRLLVSDVPHGLENHHTFRYIGNVSRPLSLQTFNNSNLRSGQIILSNWSFFKLLLWRTYYPKTWKVWDMSSNVYNCFLYLYKDKDKNARE